MTAGATAAGERWSSAQTAVAVVGLSVTLGLGQRRPEPALWINAAYHEATAAGDPVSLRLRGGTLAVLGLAGFAGRRASLRLGAGPGSDLTSAESTAAASSPGVVLDPARWLPSLFIRAAARADYRISRGILVFVAGLCDVQVATNRYVVERRPGSKEPVFEPSRLRPAVMLGVEASILGGAK
jgi:hypothetical protein